MATISASRSLALIDDEEEVVEKTTLSLRRSGFGVTVFNSCGALLEVLSHGVVFDCIVSDAHMPTLSGSDLQSELVRRGSRIPLILTTEQRDVELAVRAIKAGAHDFLLKPYEDARLVKAINDAIAKQSGNTEVERLTSRVRDLSDRQRQVMELAVQGYTNKEIATQLKISFRTVETYRAWVMERMGAKNLAELVRIAIRLGL